jgi:hypothetical protein
MDRGRDRITKETTNNIKNAIKSNEAKLDKFATELEQSPRLLGHSNAQLTENYLNLDDHDLDHDPESV